MITAIVQYRLPTSIDATACAAHFRAIAPGFRDVPGLIRKQFIYANDGCAGGVYLWRSRDDRTGVLLRSVVAGDSRALRDGSGDPLFSYRCGD
jgi:hypothetical protein